MGTGTGKLAFGCEKGTEGSVCVLSWHVAFLQAGAYLFGRV